MYRVFQGIKAVIKLAIIAFVITVIFGVYMALDAAPSGSIRSSSEAYPTVIVVSAPAEDEQT